MRMRSHRFATMILMGVAPAGPAAAQADAPPHLAITRADPTQPVTFAIAPGLTPRPALEGPPVIVAAPHPFLLTTTHYSWLCTLRAGLFEPSGTTLSADDCHLFSGPARMDLASGQELTPDQMTPRANDWRLSYDGVMAGIAVPAARGGALLVTVAHGENKNERSGNLLYPGSVNLDVDPKTCASGPSGGTYSDCWPSYNGFVNDMVTRLGPEALPTAADVEDRGPLLWPTMGYVDPVTHKKTSSGLRHPNAIAWDGFLYVFYTDSSRGAEPGRQGGVEVARARLADLPGPLTAVPYFNGGFAPQEPSLPPGFTKAAVEQFFAVRGGRASGLWPDSGLAGRFAVAHLRGRPDFLGVEDVLDGETRRVQLRVSRDLVHWSDPVVVPGEGGPGGWTVGNLHYAVLVNAAGRSESEIDPADFRVLGTDAHAGVWQKRLAVSIGP